MLTEDLEIKAEIKLYYDLHVPEGTPANAPLLLAVHGYGAHKRYMMREARSVAPAGFVVASVQAPHQHFRQTDKGYRVGFGWLTDFRPEEAVALHQHFLLELIARLAANGVVDPTKVVLFGFSQACALNFRFAFTHPDAVRAVAGVCGGIPGDLDRNEIYRPTNADVFYLYNDDDEFYSLEKYEAFDRRLREFLPNYSSKLYASKHEIVEPMREDLRDWIRRVSKF